MGGLTGEENHFRMVRTRIIIVRRDRVGEERVVRLEGGRSERGRQRNTTEE